MRILLLSCGLSLLLLGGQDVNGQSSDPATNAPTNPPVTPTTPAVLDVQKVTPVLHLPDPWTPMTPQVAAKVQLFFLGVLNGNVTSCKPTGGYTYGKNAKVNFFSSELVVLGIYPNALSPQLMLAGYQRGTKEFANGVNNNMNGIISNFAWESMYWDPKIQTLVCPASWQSFEGSTSRFRMYIIPTTKYVVAIGAFGGSKIPDLVFGNTEQAIAQITFPSDLVEPPSWGEQMTALLKH